MRWILATLLVTNVLMFFYVQFSGAKDDDLVEQSGGGDAPRVKVDTAGAFGDLILLNERVVEADNVNAPINKPVDSIKIKPKNASVGDRDVSPLVATKPNVGAINHSANAAIAQPLCTLVGQFSRLLSAEYFAEKLVALGLKAEVKHLVVSSQVGFWLHLPPQSSRKEALRRLSELQRQGVDSYVIPNGDLANGISLGMFSQQNRAEKVKKSILKLGYAPEILTVPREQREIWVFLPQGESIKISAERWSELLSGKELVEKRQNLCSDVASA